MKAFLIILSVLGLGSASALANADSTLADTSNTLLLAEATYMEGEYEKAYEYWTAHSQSNTLVSPDVYYNLGNAAWKMDKLGEAIWHWEKALKLNPNMVDAKHNLTFTQDLLVDRITPLEPTPLDAFYERVWSFLSPTHWGVLAVMSFIMLMVSLILIKYWKSSMSRFFIPLSLVFLISGLFSSATGWKHQSELDKRHMAVVLVPNIYVKNAPLLSGADAFILHEGTQMAVIQRAGAWLEIRLADGKVGWVQVDEVGVY